MHLHLGLGVIHGLGIQGPADEATSQWDEQERWHFPAQSPDIPSDRGEGHALSEVLGILPSWFGDDSNNSGFVFTA